MSESISLVDRLSDNRFTKPIKRAIVRSLVRDPRTRWFVNAFYRSLSDAGKSKYHGRYASAFAGTSATLAAGHWTVEFLGRTLRLPLRPDHAWLDWDLAVAILGHDLEVKRTYAEVVQSADRPDLFLDVGANYGTHSLLFNSAGIQTISFEPNERCLEYFRLACSLNGFDPKWEAVALGNRQGTADLVFPERKTWHGSVVTEVIEALERNEKTTVRQVPLRKLDDYLDAVAGRRVLMKVDVEGAEVAVLEGAARLLQEVRPMIVFESNRTGRRAELHALLVRHSYAVETLPWTGRGLRPSLQVAQFVASDAGNFLARYRPS
ncbi:MAG: FkbM family methyltransferase [Reyranella sp.]|uniref:FkbM family methyltransferase n=1 Tax=Reyranella sp. TaxID=1929291 RepID=UPI003D0EF61A